MNTIRLVIDDRLDGEVLYERSFSDQRYLGAALANLFRSADGDLVGGAELQLLELLVNLLGDGVGINSAEMHEIAAAANALYARKYTRQKKAADV